MGGASKSESSSRQFVDPNQVPFLDFLRTQAQQLAQAQSQQIGGVASQLSGRLGGIGTELLGGITSQAEQFGPGVGQSIQGLLGGGLDFQSLLEPGQQLPGALSSLDEAIQRNLGTTLGTIGQQSTLAGQTGGDRQAFFSAEAGGEAQRSFAAGAAGLIGQDLGQRRALGATAAQSELARLLGAGQLGLEQQGQNLQAGGIGINALQPLFNLGLGQFGAEFAPLLALAQIIGPPTVLGKSDASAQSFNILSKSAPATSVNVFPGG